MRVVVAGTFGPIHDGHRALFSAALRCGHEGVVVGVSSDEFATESRRPDPRPVPAFEERKRRVEAEIEALDGRGRDVEIREIESEFGFADDDPSLDLLVVSPETDEALVELNRRRRERGMEPLHAVVVPYAYAEDGERVSSTRVVAGEIDEHGNVLE